MNVKKALLLTILPVTLIGSAIMLNANAEENNTTSVEGSYEVSVPANVSFDSSTKTNTMTVSGSVSKLHELNIGISSENGFKLKQNDNSIDYTLKDGDTVIKSGDSYAFPEGKDLSKYEQDSTFSKTFTLSTDGGSYAGDYTDKLIFTLTDKQCYHLGINPKDTSLTGEDITYDVYVNGTLATQGSWAFSKNIPEGSTYEVKNITVKNDKYVYDSSEGDLSGTLTKDTYVNLILVSTTNTVTFDLNGEGATCDTTSKKVAKNHVYGTLPTPIREGYIFDGWYTDATDGSVVTQDSMFNEDSDVTLYAHWTEYSYKMIEGSSLNNKIKLKATSVVFTDTKAPENTSVQDLSSIGDGSVVGWWEGTTYKISTQVSGKKVIFNENCSSMFFQCSRLSSIDFTNVDTSQVTSMEGMFVYSSVTSLDVSSFDTSNVTEMSLMFAGTNITTLDLSNFDTSKVTSMVGMFEDCKQLISLNVTSFNTSAVTSMSEMFETCSLLSSLDLSSFDTTKVSNVTSMFKKDSNLEKIYVGENFVLDAAEDDSRFPMFLGCSKLPNYNSENPVENKSMAKSVSDGGYLYVNARTVTFDANGGEFEDGSVTSKIVEKGQTYGTLPTVTKEDDTFIGWYTGAKGGEVVTEDSTFNSDTDITLYAHWKESTTYTLLSGSDFKAKIPSSATSVIFTDTTAPTSATTIDLTATNDGSVVGWLGVDDSDSSTWYVSTQTEGINVIFNEDSSNMFAGTIDEAEHTYSVSQISSISFNNVDTSQVKNMSSMFMLCINMKSLDLSNFDTENVTDMSKMFWLTKINDLTVSSFNTAKVTDMSLMFAGTDISSLNLSSFNTSNVVNMSGMFSECSKLTSLDLSNFNTENVTNMGSMFYQASALTSLDLSKFVTSKVTDMHYMFSTCSSLSSLNVENFDTSNVTTMQSMFYGCSDLKSLDVSSFNTENVTNMDWMFSKCIDLESLNLSNFNTSKVSSMEYMFYYCQKLENIDLSKFNTSIVTNMDSMFRECRSLTTLDISSFDVSKVESMNNMFLYATDLTKVYVKSQEDFERIKTGANPADTISFYLKGSDTPLTSESSSTESEDDSEENAASIAPTSEETNDVSQNNTSESTEINDSTEEPDESETESTNEPEVTVDKKEDVKTTDFSEEVVN